MRDDDLDALRQLAVDTAANARAPYSGFHVGAALRSRSGQLYRGCNMEFASFGLTLCAERAALAAAIAAEGSQFALHTAVVVARGADGQALPATPCGACRQALVEFGADAAVHFVGGDLQWHCASAAELLPHAFDLPAAR